MFEVSGFTPVSATIGGGLIGLAAALLWAGSGRIAGISGHLHGLFQRDVPDRARRALFLVGLIGGAALVAAFNPDIVAQRTGVSTLLLISAGLLVGVGTRLGSGCTSGHGVCGIGRGSARSVAATLVFFCAGVATAIFTRHLLTG